MWGGRHGGWPERPARPAVRKLEAQETQAVVDSLTAEIQASPVLTSLRYRRVFWRAMSLLPTRRQMECVSDQAEPERNDRFVFSLAAKTGLEALVRGLIPMIEFWHQGRWRKHLLPQANIRSGHLHGVAGQTR